MELVSIVVPVYNVEKYLRECIDSILSQTYKKLEIILVDDGSTDESGKICDEYVKKDSRIKAIHKENGGLSSARNTGLDIATGKYISFIDSDDYVTENFIEKMYNALQENKAEMAQCLFTKDKFESVKMQIEVLDSEQAIEYWNDIQYHNFFVIACNKLYNLKLFENLRFPLGKISEDAFTTYKVFDKAKKIVIIPDILYYYRSTPDSITNRKFSVKRYDALQAYEEEINYFKKNDKERLAYSAMVLYQHILKRYYLMTYKFIDENKNENLKILLKKIKNNFKNFVRYSHDDLKTKFKVIAFCTFPNLFSEISSCIDKIKTNK